MNIPHTTELHPETQLYNGKLGVWLFLASEVMLFGALFSTYIVLRSSAPEWPVGSTILSVPIAFFNTLVLIASSVTMVLSWAALKMNNFGRFRLYMGLTFLAGLVFLAVKAFEYNAKFSHHLFPGTSTFLAIYFTLTGLHGLHVIGGMVMNGYLWLTGKSWWAGKAEQFTNRVETAGLYWHFVDLVWIFLFPVLYLL
jgi:heme/copper-type cytochrome/quinol oxidase subunit 3